MSIIIGYTITYFDLEGLRGGSISAQQVERMFERLPIEFQNEYYCFKNIASFNMLYENSYYSFQDAMKLNDSIENNILEFGVTSVDKVISRINQNLHFFLGNNLYMEEFTEFKFTIRSLLATLVYRYSVQDRKISMKIFLSNQLFRYILIILIFIAL